MRKGIRRFFPECFKREAVVRVRTSGLSIRSVSAEPELHEMVLRKWVRGHSGSQASVAAMRLSSSSHCGCSSLEGPPDKNSGSLMSIEIRDRSG